MKLEPEQGQTVQTLEKVWLQLQVELELLEGFEDRNGVI